MECRMMLRGMRGAVGDDSWARRGGAVRGFSLVELLVVVSIVVLVIAIVLPALGNARQAARMAETQTLLTDLSNAFSQFSIDNRRNPGVFSERLMGSDDNADPNGGLTALQNAMLELAGGIVDQSDANTIEVYPGAGGGNAVVIVNPDLIGARASGSGASSYFAPRERYYNTGDAGHHHGLQGNAVYRERLPTVVDAWGNPVLLWSRDPSATGRIVLPGSGSPGSGEVAFARENSDERALFYLNSNWGVLSSESFGSERASLRTNPPVSANASPTGSMIGTGPVYSPVQRATVLTALLGSPTFPGNLSSENPSEIFPTAARGDYVLMSAGRDGVFLNFQDRRGRGFGGGPNGLPRYGDMFAGVESGGDTNDIASAFDDMVVSGGN